MQEEVKQTTLSIIGERQLENVELDDPMNGGTNHELRDDESTGGLEEGVASEVLPSFNSSSTNSLPQDIVAIAAALELQFPESCSSLVVSPGLENVFHTHSSSATSNQLFQSLPPPPAHPLILEPVPLVTFPMQPEDGLSLTTLNSASYLQDSELSQSDTVTLFPAIVSNTRNSNEALLDQIFGPEEIVSLSAPVITTPEPTLEETSSSRHCPLPDSTFDCMETGHSIHSETPSTSSNFHFESTPSSSGLGDLMRGGGGSDGAGGRQNVKKRHSVKKAVFQCDYLTTQDEPKKRKRGVWGLSKVAYDKRIMQFRYLHNLMCYQKHKTSLSTIDLSAFSAVVNHFETHHKKIKLHFPCNAQLTTFTPPNTFLNQKYSFFQPQYVRGSLVLICSMPNRNKGVKIVDINTIKLASGYSKGQKVTTRTITVFYYVKDLLVEAEILRRIRVTPTYEKVSVNFYPFLMELRNETDMLKVSSMSFVLAIMVLFLEGQYCMTSVLHKLDSTKFSILEKTIVDRMACLSEKPWITTESVAEAKKLRK